MKKKILASLLLSTVLASQVAVLNTVNAENIDKKIAANDNKISALTSQQQAAQKQVSQFLLFKQSNLTYSLKMIDYRKNLKSLRERLQNCLKTLCLAMVR